KEEELICTSELEDKANAQDDIQRQKRTLEEELFNGTGWHGGSRLRDPVIRIHYVWYLLQLYNNPSLQRIISGSKLFDDYFGRTSHIRILPLRETYDFPYASLVQKYPPFENWNHEIYRFCNLFLLDFSYYITWVVGPDHVCWDCTIHDVPYNDWFQPCSGSSVNEFQHQLQSKYVYLLQWAKWIMRLCTELPLILQIIWPNSVVSVNDIIIQYFISPFTKPTNMINSEDLVDYILCKMARPDSYQQVFNF